MDWIWRIIWTDVRTFVLWILELNIDLHAYANLRINLILLLYILVVMPCWDNFNLSFSVHMWKILAFSVHMWKILAFFSPHVENISFFIPHVENVSFFSPHVENISFFSSHVENISFFSPQVENISFFNPHVENINFFSSLQCYRMKFCPQTNSSHFF